MKTIIIEDTIYRITDEMKNALDRVVKLYGDDPNDNERLEIILELIEQSVKPIGMVNGDYRW